MTNMTSKDLGSYNCHMQLYAIYAYVHIMHIQHIYCIHCTFFFIECIFENLQHNLVAVCLLSDSDDYPIDQPLNDDQAPGGWDSLPVQPPLPAAPAPQRWSGQQPGMCKIKQAVGGTTHDMDKAVLAMDTDIGPNPYPLQS
jgi:hypothetical protein